MSYLMHPDRTESCLCSSCEQFYPITTYCHSVLRTTFGVTPTCGRSQWVTALQKDTSKPGTSAAQCLQ